MFKIILATLLTISPILGYAQVTDRVVEANGMLGVIAPVDLVKNSDFEKNVNDVINDGTLTQVCTGADVILGKCSGKWATATSGHSLRMLVKDTVPNAWFGGNCVAYFTYQFASVAGADTTAFKAYVRNGALDKISQEVVLTATYDSLAINQGRSNLEKRLIFKCPDAGDAAYLTIEHTASSSTIFNIDDAHVTQYNGVESMKISTQEQTYTPTYTGFGTVSTSNMKWYQDGAYLYVYGSFVAGTGTGVEARMSLPTGYVSSSTISTLMMCGDLGQNASSTTYFRNSTLCEPNVAYTTFGIQNSTNSAVNKALGNTFGVGAVIQVNAKIPIAGASNYNTVPASLADTPRTPYTPTFTGFGTVTNVECYQWLAGEFGYVDCKATAGTVTAVEGRVSIPWTPSTWTQGNKAAGTIWRAGTATSHGGSVIMQSGTAYLTFSDSAVFGAGSVGALTTATGSTIVLTGEAFHFTARVPVAGRVPTANAFLAGGLVWADSSSSVRKARAFIQSTGVVTYLAGVTPWLTSCGSTNSKTCTFLNTPPTQPQCLVSTTGTSSASATNIQTVNSTNIQFNGFLTTTAASSNVDITVDCEWPK